MTNASRSWISSFLGGLRELQSLANPIFQVDFNGIKPGGDAGAEMTSGFEYMCIIHSILPSHEQDRLLRLSD